MALGFVGHNAVLLLKFLATDVAGELVEGVRIVLLHVPVEGSLLSTGESTDLTPEREDGAVTAKGHFHTLAGTARGSPRKHQGLTLAPPLLFAKGLCDSDLY